LTIAIFLFISLILVSIQTAVPFLVKRSVVFGVNIPEKFLPHDSLISYKKTYALLLSLVSLSVMTLYLVWALQVAPSEEKMVLIGTVIQVGIILFSLALYFYFHGKTTQLKRNHHWGENAKQVKVADLSIQSQDAMMPWSFYLLPIVMTIGVIGYTVLQYGSLPEQIPTHWGINGEADAFTKKTPMSAILMPVTLLAILVMMISLHFGKKNSGIKLSATSVNASRLRQLTLRKYSSWFMFIVSLLLTVMFSLFQLNTIHPDLLAGATMAITPILFLVLMLAGTIVFAVKVGRSDKIQHTETTENVTDFDEDAHWIGGLIYFNKNDPSILVEKRFGIGWTLNFGNPIGYLIVCIPFIIILVLSFM
jgi:uncharacterized membrane protein